MFCSFVQLLDREVNPGYLGSEKQERVRSSLALNHKFFLLPKVEWRKKGSPLCGFFGTMRHFLENIWILSKGAPLNFSKFLVCKKTSNMPKGSHFGFFGNMRLFLPNIFLKKNFKVFQLLFLESF